MIDHVSIKVKDVEQAKAFYEAALAPLGYVKGIEYPGGMQLLVEGEPVSLTYKEFELLYFLAKRPNQVFTRDQLLDKIWGYEYIGDTRTVDVHIKRIREKFDQKDPWNVKTVWGVGYKFEVE